MKVGFVGVLLAIAMGTTPVLADSLPACLAAADSGQTLRASHKLIEARDQFRQCAAATCPSAIQTDCTKWVSEADSAIPTVVLAAKDAAGNDTFDAKVTVDDAPFATTLEGTALPVNPGAHTFRFRLSSGASMERRMLVEEGQKAIVVAVSFAAPLAPATRAPARSLWHTVGWIVGGVGIVGLGLGAVFTGVTLSDRSAGDCDANACHNFGAVSSAKSAAPVAGVGLIGGGALVATGAALLLLTRSPKERPTAPAAEKVGLQAVPVIHPQGGGMVLEGFW